MLRSLTLSMRQRDFVQAAIVSGEAHWRIVVFEILPNMISLFIAGMIGLVTGAVGYAASLAFLGLGNLNEADWFTILYWAQQNSALEQGAWWTFAIPGGAICLLGLSTTLINYGIDEISNPRLRMVRRKRGALALEQVPSGASRPAHAAAPSPSKVRESAAPLLEIRDLVVEYRTPSGPARAVDRVSFSILPGEVMGLAGESGCGKSTIAHAVLRLIKQPGEISGGQILFQGRDLLGLSQKELQSFRWRESSIVFQSAMNSLNPVLSLSAQMIDMMQAHERISKRAAIERAKELFELVGIEPRRLNSFPHELSGGMRQRAVVAMALALRPELIIMDEPTTALDVVVQRDILQKIQELQRSLGFSVLFITHDLSLLVEFSTRIGIMYAGKIVEMAQSRDLFDHPEHPYTEGLMKSFPSIHGPKTVLHSIPGSPPNLVNPPAGCRFAPRCAHVSERCLAAQPPLLRVAEQHESACYLSEAGARVRPS